MLPDSTRQLLDRSEEWSDVLAATQVGSGFESSLARTAMDRKWEVSQVSTPHLDEFAFGMPYGERRDLSEPFRSLVQEAKEGEVRLLILSEVDRIPPRAISLLRRLLAKHRLGLEENAPRLAGDVRIIATTHDLREAARVLSPEVMKGLTVEIAGAHEWIGGRFPTPGSPVMERRR